MKPTPVTRLFARADIDPPRDAGRPPYVNPLLGKGKDQAATAPKRPLPLFARDLAPKEARASPALRPVFARAQDGDPARNSEPPAAHRPTDHLARIEQAYERGIEEGRRLERLENERRNTEDLVASRERAILERVEFQLNEYANFGSSISAALEALEQRVTASVARILEPIVEERLAEEALSELVTALRHMTSNRSSGLLRIRGPERLISKLRTAIEQYAVDVEYILEDRLDVTVEADDTMIETQLGQLSELLHRANER